MTIKDRILAALQETEGAICDDCLAANIGLKYRQEAYSRCSAFGRQGLIERGRVFCGKCSKNKIVSYLKSGFNQFLVSQTLESPTSANRISGQILAKSNER